ncbi:YaaC-like protein [Halanaerobium saccharolyticum]|uniref:YaaC-like protein n=1 Tax=Halanaerobium saccharolyticum TaxID=43595 RepID=A0A4R7YUP9_9FIRM|nr:YaaC family protein [Halanaerobium saccharolyticum]RAK05269.1 YaaC-like protein [Halanaerobium saccharolyticum]TDV99634.1 YaaC-like protein [Halanaerobium saccharolyticum]TDX51750.1 YaaC-like protein [Halanaerobium saccharolyticum]
MKFEKVLTDDPIKEMWNRLDILSTISGAKKFLKERINEDSEISEEILEDKAKGIAFCIRSAREFFQTEIDHNMSTASISFYYGTFNFLSALLLADIENNYTLKDIEKFSSYGHGFKLFNNTDEEKILKRDNLIVNSNGFFYKFLKELNYDENLISMQGKYYSLEEVEEEEKYKIIDIKELISRIPELRNTFIEIFNEQPLYLNLNCRYNLTDQELFVKFPFDKNSPYLSDEDIYQILDWPNDIELSQKIETSRLKIITRDKINKNIIPDKKELHKSVLCYDCYIKPLLGIEDIFLIYFMFLYVLSIWTRYRPNLWREIVEGRFDIYRPLITKFLTSSERILPNIFLNKIYNRRFLFTGHSYLG